MTATETLTLSGFLLARLAEDETEARLGPYLPCDDQAHPGADIFHPGGCQPTTAHRRLLAEVEAHRRIVEMHTPGTFVGTPDGDASECPSCFYAGPEDERKYGDAEEGSPYPCFTLRVLGSVYADHPDFREEWAL